MPTYSPKASEIQRAWHVVDAEGMVLGRLATEVARILRGKHKPTYTPHADCGDFVVIVNADKLQLTGNKLRDKLYYRHSGYLGGIKSLTAGEMVDKNPARVIELAIKGMLPRGPLGRQMLKKLKVYAGPDHPHAAQQPKHIEL